MSGDDWSFETPMTRVPIPDSGAASSARDDGSYVRGYYRVPARPGGRVVVDGHRGTIAGFDSQYLLVRFDGREPAVRAHPTWKVEYEAASEAGAR